MPVRRGAGHLAPDRLGVRPDPAQGIFETLLVRAGQPLELELHLERLARSLETVYGGALPPDLPSLMLGRTHEVDLGRERVTLVPACAVDCASG